MTNAWGLCFVVRIDFIHVFWIKLELFICTHPAHVSRLHPASSGHVRPSLSQCGARFRCLAESRSAYPLICFCSRSLQGSNTDAQPTSPRAGTATFVEPLTQRIAWSWLTDLRRYHVTAPMPVFPFRLLAFLPSGLEVWVRLHSGGSLTLPASFIVTLKVYKRREPLAAFTSFMLFPFQHSDR
jgi:hypothetical protein